MNLPISIDQALILGILAFAFRSYQRFDKSADKIDMATQKLEELEKKLETKVQDHSEKIKEMEMSLNEMNVKGEALKAAVGELNRKFSGQYSLNLKDSR